ncbi:Amino-acid permease 2 [Verticillium dahliae VDG1]|nr:Amino-acid permease 2 [Verticillium dahliae VDG1]
MFGSFPAIASLPRYAKIDPKDIPPPTPLALPHSQPQLQSPPSPPASSAQPLVHLIQTVYRPGQVAPSIFEALGVHVIPDTTVADLLPDPAYVPDFATWDALSADEARQRNDETKRPLNTGVQSPGCQTYQDRKRELSISNQDAYRVVRRLPPLKGQQQARLGNAYEFYRCLEAFTTFWDDTSKPTPPTHDAVTAATADDSSASTDVSTQGEPSEEPVRAVRTAAGTSMPGDYRQNLVNAFLKLVAYDFGCNASASRAEPRLHLIAPSVTPSTKASHKARQRLRRPAPTALLTDLLVPFQPWWTTERRWGGGQGGPIGREVDRDVVSGDKDAAPSNERKAEQATAALGSSSSGARPGAAPGMPVSKRPRKQMSIYDNYRMVRPPSASWDQKTRYEAIGKARGAGYDDIFVVSSLFHHVSILRVRVPDRLLEVLGGAPDEYVDGKRSWGGLEVRRSRWFDLFLVDQRIEAMELVWGVMAWMMRAPEPERGSKEEDVKMAGT